MTRQTRADDGTRTAELWVRAEVPGAANDRQERLRERAMDVSAFDDVRTRLVPNRLSLTGLAAETPAGEALRDDVVDARRWANAEAVDLEPYLPVSEETNLLSDVDRRVLTLPTVTLVEYDDGIAHVSPHVDGDRVVSVESRLDALVREHDDGADDEDAETERMLAEP